MIKHAALILLLTTPAQAEVWLNNKAIDLAFNNKTIDGEYVDGKTFTETYRPDGEADYIEDMRNIKGVWSIENNTFCTLYEDMNGGCFSVQLRGSNCFEFYFAADRPSQTEGAKPNRWVARGWYKDKPKTCGDLTV